MKRTLGVTLSLLILTTAVIGAQSNAQWQDVVRNLRNPNAEARLAAVARIGEAAYVPAAEPLAALVTDPDDRVQVAAIEAELGLFQSDRIGNVRVLGLGGPKSRAQTAFEAGPLYRSALRPPPVLIERLITAMRDEHPRVRFDAVHALGFIAVAPLDPAQAKLLAAELDHYDPIMRAATARVLTRLRAREAADQVAVAVSDSNATVRIFATEALGVLGDTKAAMDLRSQLGRVRGDLLQATFLALARRGEREDIEYFRARTADRSAFIRLAAFEGLGRAGDKDSIDLLTKALQSERSDAARTAAAFALTLLGRPQAHIIASHLVLDEVTAQARDYLLELGRPAIPSIEATLKVATNNRHRADLLQLIGYVGTADDAALVQPFASDKDERVRRAAAAALQRLRR